MPPLPQQKQEEIVIIDDDEDDVIVEAMVRSVQMAEDEAFARSLQVKTKAVYKSKERVSLQRKAKKGSP